jgi:hypothetical protein
MNDPIDLDLRTPKAKVDYPTGVQLAQFKLTPTVQADRAKQILERV